MHKLAIFASGTGSNAQKIIDYFRGHPFVEVSLIVSNKPTAGVLNIAGQELIPALILERDKFFSPDAYASFLREVGISFIALAGFLWKVPEALINAYPHRIINIHPALLPKYGGKGMYGSAVHRAILKAGEPESGITIHYVDDQYDHGQPILQVKCPVEAGDTPETLAGRIHALEHYHYPRTIEKLLAATL